MRLWGWCGGGGGGGLDALFVFVCIVVDVELCKGSAPSRNVGDIGNTLAEVSFLLLHIFAFSSEGDLKGRGREREGEGET